jgi:tRNA threonylcarbamoyl adenosine modification protein YjeE
MKFMTQSESETVKEAEKLASGLKSGDVILLYGSLGSGKTVFARGLIRALAGNKTLEIPSPTFTLLQTYDSPKGSISHYDLYRLKDPDEMVELGWDESLQEGITIVEWPERLGVRTPVRRLDIRLENIKNNPESRKIEVIRVDVQ